ncbi:uncharacterized protein LOC113865210 [Abrus precatorius]|uniref:Uncharacterized protein LOC113865210 n=1 Tax=Abrus precatorius TaxID=3816 RepID=A0A8B8LH55_ABRPR|nr:uncharacterized protein LOC113865210 [Abrus precatorius]
MKEEPSVPISLIQERISDQFGYSISYKKAWKAKQKVIVTAFGDWNESYAALPRWLEYMQLHAPGSVYQIETNDYVEGRTVDNRFRVFYLLYWSFKQCHEAFNFCKPIIQVDETFLYGKYRQTLIIAMTQDGNNCVLPISFAIVEGETLSSRVWTGLLGCKNGNLSHAHIISSEVNPPIPECSILVDMHNSRYRNANVAAPQLYSPVIVKSSSNGRYLTGTLLEE